MPGCGGWDPLSWAGPAGEGTPALSAASTASGALAGPPAEALSCVLLAAVLITAMLSLDTTVVLLTRVVHDTAVRLRVRPKPHVYACTHLANSASLLLPVSSLTNLLAFSVAGLTLIQFGGLMAVPWLVVIAVEYLALRWFFAGDLAAGVPGVSDAPPAADADRPPPAVPRFTLVALAATLAGFVLASLAGLNPAWAAGAGPWYWLPGRWPAARTPGPACCARPASRSCCSCWAWASWSRLWCATAWAARSPG
jgi:arsenical pump membrane protein